VFIIADAIPMGRLIFGLLLLSPLLAHAQPADTSWAYANERHAMVAEQVEARGISNADVLAALRRVPRHRLVPDAPPTRRRSSPTRIARFPSGTTRRSRSRSSLHT
jgi:hypothetical protein